MTKNLNKYQKILIIFNLPKNLYKYNGTYELDKFFGKVLI